MHHYTQGKTTKQAHKGIPEGLYEEEQGLQGFFGPVSHLLKKNPSTRWTSIEGPLRPRMFDLARWKEGDLEQHHTKILGQRMFYNNQLNVGFRWISKNERLPVSAERNADGDLVYFCHQGCGYLLTEFGLLEFRKGHYLVVPKCLTHAFVAREASCFLVIENRGSHYESPDRGLVGQHAIYDINGLGKPDLSAMNSYLQKSELAVSTIEVKHSDEWTRFDYDECIFDVVGWKGDLYPYSLHVDDMMPLMSHRAHLPPSAHTTFVARDFVICTFLPRPLESDADALKVPFYHQNIDYDEILFYHAGDFFSRDNLHPGMLSFHPAGFPHGPHPKAFKSVGSKTQTNEYAVMIDSRWPLKRDEVLEGIELPEYWKSWK